MHQRRNITEVASRTDQALFWGALALMAAALLLGGATREGALANGAVRLLSLPVAMLAIWRLSQARWRKALFPILILAAVLAVPFAQLVPLPPALWAGLPGRAEIVQAYTAAGIELPWMPYSLSPDGALNAGLSLLPPAAMFLSVLVLEVRARYRLALLILALTTASVLLGVVQVADGPLSALRPYETTNDLAAVGFFANRNHLASLLVTALPLATAWILLWWRRPHVRRVAVLAVSATGLLALIIGIGAVQSRAGVLLLAPTALGCALMALRGGVFHVTARRALALGFIAAVGVFVLQFGAYQILEELSSSFQDEARVWTAPVIAQGAMQYLPLGSGLGTFDPIYRMLERPEILTNAFLNHAHNDYLELWLETGLVLPLLLLAFLVWYLVQTVGLWRSHAPWEDLARAATIVIGVLLVHSAVDYPLRTAAMATIFAFACACLIAPVARPVRAAIIRPNEDAAGAGEI